MHLSCIPCPTPALGVRDSSPAFHLSPGSRDCGEPQGVCGQAATWGLCRPRGNLDLAWGRETLCK